jgi:hypothetical protein
MRKLLATLALVPALMAPALAHHSPAAFEAQKTVSLRGVVKEFRWQNPHTWIELTVKDPSGKDVLWAVELTSPTYLIRAGWKSNTIKPGEEVSIVGRPLKTGEAGSAIFVSLTLADGRTLLERPARLGGGPEAK